MFWKKKKHEEISQLNSDEYEKVSNRITLLRTDFDILENKLGLLQSNFRRLNLRIIKDMSEEQLKTESLKNNEKLHI